MKIERLSLVTKICYGVGGIPYMIFINCLGLFITPFLLEQAQIKPIQMSIVLFAAKGFDGITDPFIGLLVSKTRTRFGKYRPWIICSMPFIICSYMMIWYVPDISTENKTWWYLGFYCSFQLFLTCQRVPYISFTMLLTPNQTDRDSATGFRSIFEVIAVLFAVIIQGTMITIYGRKVTCANNNSSSIWLNGTLDLNDSSRSISPKYNELNEGYLLTAGIGCVFCFVCTIATYFGTKEMKEVVEDKKIASLSAFKAILRHKPYLSILAIFSCFCVCTQILQANTALYCKYTLEGGKQSYQYVLGVNLLSSVISLPAINLIMRKIGKIKTYSLGIMIFILALILISFLKKIGWEVYVVAVMIGYAAATNYLVPWSMLPDVIDDYFIKTGAKHESFFYAFFYLLYKIIGGLALAFSSFIIGYAGYIDCPNGCCDQPKSVALALRLLMIGPILTLLLALVFLWKHPIKQKKIEENNELLFQLRNNNLTARL